MAIFGKQIGQIISATASTIASVFSNAPVETPEPTDIVPFVRETPAEAATAELEVTGPGTPSALLTVGNKTYTIVASTPGTDEIAVGADAEEFALNIQTAINADTVDTLCTAAIVSFTTIVLTANDAGNAGNSIPLSTNDDDIIISFDFEGGSDAIANLQQTTVDDLLALSGVAIGSPVGSGTSGSILFVDGAGNLAQANANAYINPSTAELLLTASGATRTPVTLKGTSGQTAALLRFEEHGSSTATAAITASGIIGGSSIIPQQEWFCSLRRIAGAHNLASIGGNGGENSFMLWQPALKSTESHYATITSDQNDFSITPWAGCVLRLTSDASRNITGFTLGGGAVPQGFNVKILNVGANNIVLKHQNTGSAAAYRIITPTGGDLTIAPDGVASLWYDETTGRWRAFPNF